MDGLLLDTERVALMSFVETVRPFGLREAPATDLFLTLVGSSSTQTTARLRTQFGDAAPEIEARWGPAFVAGLQAGVPIKPTVQTTLEALASLRHPMAVVTSTKTAHATSHLTRAGLAKCFKAIIGGDSVTANKPDPAPYLAGAAALGVLATDCVAFEDSDRGVTSAIAAGCSVWQIPDLRPVDQPFPQLGQRQATTLAEAAQQAGLLPA